MKTKIILRNLFFISTIACTLFISSCSKKRIEPKEEQLNSYESMNSYYDSKKQQEQEFVIDTSGSGPIVGNQGTKLWVSKEKLMFPNGDSVTWPYSVKLIELYTPKDMLYYQMPNVSNGTLLTTSGEVRVRAFKNGQELVLRPSNTWTVEMPNTNPLSNMKIYYGVDNTSYIDWTDNPAGNFNTSAYGYTGDIAKLGWVNCGKPAAVSSSTTNYTFTSSTDELQNVSKFIYFTNAKSLMQVYGSTSGALPLNENIKIILIGINGSQLYDYYNETQVSSSNQIVVTMSSISDASLTAILDSL